MSLRRSLLAAAALLALAACASPTAPTTPSRTMSPAVQNHDGVVTDTTNRSGYELGHG